MAKPKVYKDENALEGQWVVVFPGFVCHHKNWRGALFCADQYRWVR